MIRRLTVREKRIFIATLAVVILAILYNGLIGPLQEEKDFLDQEIALQQKQLTREWKVIGEAKALDAQYDVYLKRFRQSGPEEEMASSILSEIEGAAGRFGLHVTDLKPQRIKHNEHDNQFSVSLTISSELVDVLRFLYVLQQQPYFFDVEEVEFERLARRKQSTITTRLVLGKAFISL
ncbi:MAG: type II secretion system protein M [Candidatus Omnitrophica bacterium]|nr:type II secretion system protein M [Candidatus Omnitrophota bacterium]